MVSTPDFRNGANVTELNKERAEKAEELNEYLQDLSNSRKKGKAETFRLAIDMAYDRLQEMKEEKQERLENIKDLRAEEKEYLEKLED